MGKLKQAAIDLEDLSESLGYDKTSAIKLKRSKLKLFSDEENYEHYLIQRDKITMALIYPLDMMGGYVRWMSHTQQQRQSILWEIGINNTDFPCLIDAGCTSFGGKRICGYLLIGQERADKEWCTKIVDNKHVASWEAQMSYKNDWSLRRELGKLSRGM